MKCNILVLHCIIRCVESVDCIVLYRMALALVKCIVMYFQSIVLYCYSIVLYCIVKVQHIVNVLYSNVLLKYRISAIRSIALKYS